VFWVSLNGRGLSGVAITDRATVNYQCLWETFYRALGEQPPANGSPVIDATSIFKWWAGLDPRQQEIVSRLTAAPMNDVIASVSASTARVVPPK
jgi:hypothetical protein